MSDNLPQEVLIEILIRTPIKSLLRSTIVCKSWHSLITSPTFITTHFAHANTHILLVRRFSKNTESERFSLHFDDDDASLPVYAQLHFPFRVHTLNRHFRILNSCNGLLCLTDDEMFITDYTVLWNPAVRKYMVLPQPIFTCYAEFSHFSVLGFGFDRVTNDYKVVRMLYPLVPQCKQIHALTPVVELYKLSTGCWESISPPASPCIADRNSLQAFVNGAVHWLATHREPEGGVLCAILSFSMVDECFGEVVMPESLANEEFVVNMSVTVIGGLLSLVPFKRYPFMPSQHNSIWVMKEYGVVESWTKLFTISDDLLGGSGRTFGIANNPGRVMIMTSHELILYDHKADKCVQFGVISDKGPIFVTSHSESLVLLERQDGVRARGTVVSY